MPLSPDGMYDAIVRNLPARTGRTIAEWVALVRSEGPPRRRDRIEWLKREHGMGHSTAGIIAADAEKPDDYVPATHDELVARQYAGPKKALRQVYERLAEAAAAIAPDVQIDARQTYVSLIRRRQFGIIQPTTRTRVDLGLALTGVAPTGRLQPSGTWGSGRTTMRVGLSGPEEADDELIGWMRAAYEQN